MIYPFKCRCGKYVEVYRPVAEASKIETCGDCGAAMDRQYTAPMIDSPWFDYYDSGLGRHITSKQDIERAKSDYKSRTGHNLVEVGSEGLGNQVKLKEYDIPRGVFDNAISD